MPVELLWWPAADDALSRLEAEPDTPVLAGVRRTLGLLERDPFDPRLHTRQFVTEAYGHVRATPSVGDWFVLWQLGDEKAMIEIIMLAELTL